MLSKKVTPADSVEYKEATDTTSRCQLEMVCSKKDLFSSSDGLKDALNGNADKPKYRVEATEHELSVLDILGDSEPDANNSVESLPEAHVAFSVEECFCTVAPRHQGVLKHFSHPRKEIIC